ncbi:Adrenodoxin-like protein 2 [Diplonema papillatum]|nr:Adrenodoxin-like protein 2 [Diplonema papillatum]
MNRLARAVLPRFAASQVASRRYCTDKPLTVTWLAPDGTSTATKCKEGENLLDIAHDNGLNVEGACDGVCACSTCHVIVNTEWYDKLPEASDEEEDMLDQAFELTPTSRLGCQVKMTPELDGLTIKIPRYTRNLYVDGHVPHHH